MKKRKIGKLEVSAVGMGCMAFSHGYGKAPEREYSIQAIRNAYASGCTFFDTAEGYGKEQFEQGHNERLLGEAVHPFRNEVILATKFRIEPEELTNQTMYDAIKKHLDQSLKNLDTDYIDLYYLHRVNEEVDVKEIAKVMGQFIAEGKIREWGLSAISVETLDKVQKITPVAAVQNIYNILERDCEEEMVPYCIKNHIALVPFSPIASGFFSGKIKVDTKFEEQDDVRNLVPQLTRENIEANQPILDILHKFASQKNATLAQISLAWMLHKSENIIPIPGSKNQERIIENLHAEQIELNKDEFETLEKALNTCVVHGHRGSVEFENRKVGYNR